MMKNGWIWMLCFGLAACSGPDSNSENDGYHDTMNAEVPGLNEGEKWRINSEMSPFVAEGEQLVDGFSDSGDLTRYHELAQQLDNANQSLIRSCTMTGQSHEELHKWLHPHLELTKSLSKAQNLEEARTAFEKIKNSYAQFHNFFYSE